MRVTVRVFARLRELAGAGEFAREIAPGATAADVWQTLLADVPAMAPWARSVSVAVNAEYARMQTPLSDGDEIAFGKARFEFRVA